MNGRPRILLAGIFHETHCFVPDLTPLSDFRVERGEEILARRGDGSQIDGFIEVADARGWVIVPTCVYTATPSGTVEDAVLDAFWGDLLPSVRAEAKHGIDAVFLSLHGAMVTESVDDVEGSLLERLRAVGGLSEVPIFGVFDLHATLTEKMTQLANGLVCYRENPHIDARDSGRRAALLLHRCLASGTTPRMYRRKAPIVWPPAGTGTAESPMWDLEQAARRLEAEHEEIWAVNVVAGFAFADAPDAGVCFSVISEGSQDQAADALARLHDLAMELREKGLTAEVSPEQALDAADRLVGRGPVLLVEPSDNIGAGALGNGTGVLRALLRRRTASAGVIINDPEAVTALSRLPSGARATLPLGGKGNPYDVGPVELDVEIVSHSDGKFDLEDLNSHLVASVGRHIDMGPSVVVRHGGIVILLTSKRTPPNDLGQWRSQGINPEELGVIGIKAAVAHRRAYDPIAAASFTVRTPGPCTSDPRELPYTRINRPIFPLDDL